MTGSVIDDRVNVWDLVTSTVTVIGHRTGPGISENRFTGPELFLQGGANRAS